MRRFDIQRPGKILTRIQKAFGNATSNERRTSLIRRHAVAELHVNRLLELASIPAVNDKIH